MLHVFGTPGALFYWIWNLIKIFGVRKLEFYRAVLFSPVYTI